EVLSYRAKIVRQKQQLLSSHQESLNLDHRRIEHIISVPKEEFIASQLEEWSREGRLTPKNIERAEQVAENIYNCWKGKEVESLIAPLVSMGLMKKAPAQSKPNASKGRVAPQAANDNAAPSKPVKLPQTLPPAALTPANINTQGSMLQNYNLQTAEASLSGASAPSASAPRNVAGGLSNRSTTAAPSNPHVASPVRKTNSTQAPLAEATQPSVSVPPNTNAAPQLRKMPKASVENPTSAKAQKAKQSPKTIKTAEKKVHKNSLDYVGDTHLYVIRDAKTGVIQKYGESAAGKNKLGQSKRAQAQVRKLEKQNPNKRFESEIVKEFPSKKAAKDRETRSIKTHRKVFGGKGLPLNKGIH
ncbi:MAG TPA: hypothetical protein VMW10_00495, partial [Alphaproteobacteria bacterium]|nr:hypothetical protein [Alphaproteobacteria bacterium]